MNIKSKAFLAYMAVFLLGGASGFFLNEAIHPGFFDKKFEHGPGMNNEMPFQKDGDVPERIKQFMINRLDLQENQIDPFFEIQSEHLEEIMGLIREHRNEELDMLRENYADFIDDIDEVLTEEQIEELNSFAHPDSVHKRRMERHRQRGFR